MGLSSVRRKKDGEISSAEADAEGLRIVIVEVDEYSNTIVIKSGLKALTRKPIISSPSNYCNDPSSLTTSNGGFSCFLKSCHLCKKPLSPDKDIYMYRGDQGFCSVDCRSRQIMLDEMKEDEIKKKRRLKDASTSTIDCVGCETCRLLKDLRKRRYLRNNTTKYKQAHALISPAKHQPPLLSLS